MTIDNINNYMKEYFNIINSINGNTVLDIVKLIDDSELIVFCGNGGSYANATHMAGDILINSPITGNTIAIGDNMVSFSASSNDIGYNEALSIELEKRIVGIKGLKTVILLSTSGASNNIIIVGRKAKKCGCKVISLVGANDKFVKEFSDVILTVDNMDAGFVEAAHCFIGHLFVRLLCNKNKVDN